MEKLLKRLSEIREEFTNRNKEKRNTHEFFRDIIEGIEDEAERIGFEYSGRIFSKLKRELESICLDIAANRAKGCTIIEEEVSQEKRINEILDEIIKLFKVIPRL
jgi:hypothetical protein